MGHRRQGDAEPLQYSSPAGSRPGVRMPGARRTHTTASGSASPPEGVGLPLDVWAGTQLLHPSPHTQIPFW